MGFSLNIFLWLVAGFLVADYPLQLNVVFQTRYKYRLGGLLHVGIHTLTGLICLIPYWNHWRTWAAFLATMVLHYFVDTVNKKNIYMWFADQAIHVAAIAAVAVACYGLTPMSLHPVISKYYGDFRVPLYISGYVAATFAGTIFIFFLRGTFRKDYQPGPILLYEKTTGVLSRAWVTTAVILGAKLSPAFFLAAPLPELVRFYIVLKKKGDAPHYRNIYPMDVVVSFIYAAAIGAALSFV